MKNLYLLGAAGSIGMQTLDVILEEKDAFNLIGISLGSNDELNHTILKTHQPKIVCLRTPETLVDYKEQYPNMRFVYGDEGLLDIAKYPEKGLFINALSGSSGLMPTVFAITSGKDIALANKETLVMAGDHIKQLVAKHHVNLYPIDSEHSSLWQLLRGEDIHEISSLIITASGGSFRDLPREALKTVTIEDALKHPNWSMGKKITIDSATMMNKGLEVIEAHHLFDIPYDKIHTVLHNESIVHGMVSFIDGTVKASLSTSDMRIPIRYALHYPKRISHPTSLSLTSLNFKSMDFERFPLLALAYEVGKQKGLLPTVMNAANEAAVTLFLKSEISFLMIEDIVIQTVKEFINVLEPSLELIIETNHKIQHMVLDRYRKR